MSQLSLTFPKHFALLSPDDLYDSASPELLSCDKGLLKRVSAGTKLRSRAYFVLPPAFQQGAKRET